jgi:exopolyphosphatase/guanosine-5'-triphosphate,3'-diphosphate pyrophosphatase
MVKFPPSMKPIRRAVIDVGTNSVKLLVGEVSDGLVVPVDERSEQTRLGAGFYEAHLLQPIPIARTASAVAEFVALARESDAQSLRLIATSAARDAKNSRELLEAVWRSTGLRLEVISGEQEAEWVFRGVTSDARFRGRKLLIVDVGGGSTEFIFGQQDHHSSRHSFPLGSVRLLEKIRLSDPPSATDLASCRQWLVHFFGQHIVPVMKEVLNPTTVSDVMLVGSGGTTTILARMEHSMKGFDRERLDSTRLTGERVLEYMAHLWSLSLAERKKIPGLPPQRADVILMGVAIYEALMTVFPLRDLHVSTRGIRFGALLDFP